MRLFALLFTLLLMNASLMQAATPSTKRVAIILDDGPTPAYRTILLDLFKKEGVHVTFGTVARNAKEHPALSRKAVAEGHEIANHSFAHEHPGKLADDLLEHEIVGAQQAFEKEVGVKPVWYWPPFLEIDERVVRYVGKAGLRVYPFKRIVSSDDYMSNLPASELFKRATTGVEDGVVILFHEWRKETVEQMPAIIAELRRQGCVFLTFSELAR